jgi:hypothetical protein
MSRRSSPTETLERVSSRTQMRLSARRPMLRGF